MRMLKFGMLFVSFFVVSVAYAESSPRQNQATGISFGYQGLALRQIFSDNNLYFVNAGYGKFSSSASYTFNGTTISSSSDSKNYSIGIGARHYLSDEKLSDFIQIELGKGWTNSSPGTTSSGISMTIGYGLEYYFDNHLSIEARAGLSYSHSQSDGSTNYDSKSYSLPVVGTAITYYW